MNILVTGGAGFIGFHLCNALLDQGHAVIAVDNFLTGTQENVALLDKHANFKFLEHDINKPLDIEVDHIYNLACPASPIHYQKDPVQTTTTNVLGMINVLELAQKNKARILQASTSEIYGDPLESPQQEEYNGNVNTLGPRACYDEGKRCAETLCMDYKRQHGTDIKIVRIFNTYGPHIYEHDGRVISNFIVQALKQQDITIYGDGSQTRSFQYIDDLIRGMIAMMQKDEFAGPVNLGNPHEVSILELAQLIIKLTGSKSHMTYEALPEDDPKKRYPDIALAHKKLEWKPRVALTDGLKKTIDYFKARM
ncbi:NAD-dependent epimerase/dehydratase family protein [Candidatus Peregrinibacteria bacterium]|nr:NAD-dependent epimerase/dehydratase family protein [Candidatus Peregrinibacteria bacterium]